MPRYRVKSQVKNNLNLWLNNLFLKDGFYSNIAAGDTDPYGRDLSRLAFMRSPSHADYRVWQSAYKNWVHESGLVPTYAITPPTLPSGVTVDGTFYPQDSTAPGYSAAYAHTFDFPNGRVIFDTAIPSTSIVQSTFSYKEISVDSASIFENEAKEFYFETSLKDNPMQTGVITYPEENARTLPLVLIDSVSRSNEPYELGVASTIANLGVSLVVWTRDEYMQDQIDDLLTAQERVVLIGTDFNTSPQPLGREGDKNPAYTNYEDYARLDSPHLWHRIYLDEITSRRLQPYYNMDRLQVNFSIRVYPNF